MQDQIVYYRDKAQITRNKCHRRNKAAILLGSFNNRDNLTPLIIWINAEEICDLDNPMNSLH